jgi:cytidylate kinase
MTASADVRAKRRFDELIARGQSVDYEVVLAEINQRDYNDSNRAYAPLEIAPDAEVIDTSNMSIEEVVSYIIRKVKKGEEK